LRLLGFALLAMVAALFIYVSEDLPDRGDPNAPANVHLQADFIEKTKDEIDVPNVVTAILADFRSYDTLGETIVIFTAGMAVFLVLGRGRPQRR
jgi:multicomponent Na+:H+ antiporter subunit B